MENPLLKYLAFVKTVEKGSFTKAAEALHYAQSSVSKMVADLENEWGMTLLERSKSGVCLTSAGEQLLPFLRRTLREYGELEAQIARMSGLEIGVVRIGTFSSAAIHWLPNILSALQRDYPGGRMRNASGGLCRSGALDRRRARGLRLSAASRGRRSGRDSIKAG